MITAAFAEILDYFSLPGGAAGPAFIQTYLNRRMAEARDMRPDELAADGDMDGRAVWLRIVKAIEELLSEERPEDAEVH